MAWVERVNENSWRVRFRRDDDTIGNITGFTSEDVADNYALDMESDKRKGSWIDPTAGQTTIDEFVPDWLDALDVDKRTEDNYAVCYVTTSNPAGARPVWLTSPTSKSRDGRNNCGRKGWPKSPSTA